MTDITEDTFENLVDFAAGEIMKGLIAGRFRADVWHMMNLAVRWKSVHDKKESENG